MRAEKCSEKAVLGKDKKIQSRKLIIIFKKHLNKRTYLDQKFN